MQIERLDQIGRGFEPLPPGRINGVICMDATSLYAMVGAYFFAHGII